MLRLVALISATAVLLGACTSLGTLPASPTIALPTSTPIPVASTPTPSPTSLGPTLAPQAVLEAELLAGVRADARIACAPQRSDLPLAAVAGVECRPRPDLVKDLGFYLFGTQGDLLETYFARLAGQGVSPRSGDCFAGPAGEGAYTPGDGGPDFIAARQGCFVDPVGRAHFLAALPGLPIGGDGYVFGGPFVLVVVDGQGADPGKLKSWAWLGNEAVPGDPTIWRRGGP